MTSEEIETQFFKIIFQGISNIKKKTSKMNDQTLSDVKKEKENSFIQWNLTKYKYRKDKENEALNSLTMEK